MKNPDEAILQKLQRTEISGNCHPGPGIEQRYFPCSIESSGYINHKKHNRKIIRFGSWKFHFYSTCSLACFYHS